MSMSQICSDGFAFCRLICYNQISIFNIFVLLKEDLCFIDCVEAFDISDNIIEWTHETQVLKEAELLAHKANCFAFSDAFGKASAIYKQVLSLLNTIPYEYSHFRIYELYCNFLRRIGELKKAIKLVKELKLKISEENTLEKYEENHAIIFNLGTLYFELGEFDKSADILEPCVKALHKENGNITNGLCGALGLLARIYASRGDFKTAKKTVKKLKKARWDPAYVRCLQKAIRKKNKAYFAKEFAREQKASQERKARAQQMGVKVGNVAWIRRSVRRIKECVVCFAKDVELFQCSGCEDDTIWYCGKEHQVYHWKEHQHHCRKFCIKTSN